MNTTSNQLSPIVLPLVVKLDASISRRASQRFFGKMQKAVHRRGLHMNWSGGICLAASRERSNWREDRHKILNWLVDQPEVRDIYLVAPMPLRKMLVDGLYLEFEAIRLQETVPEATGSVIGHILMGLITRAIMALQIDAGAGHDARR